MTTDEVPVKSPSRWWRRGLYVAVPAAAALAGFAVGAFCLPPVRGPDPLFGLAFGAGEVLDVR